MTSSKFSCYDVVKMKYNIVKHNWIDGVQKVPPRKNLKITIYLRPRPHYNCNEPNIFSLLEPTNFFFALRHGKRFIP